MDHIRRDVQPRFRRQEQHTPPIALQHPRHIGARQADARHHIELEKPHPLGVGDGEEILRAIDADIVDENGARGFGLHQRVATGSGREVSGDPAQLCVRYARPHTGDGPIDVSLRKPVDDDSRATLRKTTGDGKADTACRAGDDRSHARKFDLHSTFPRCPRSWRELLSSDGHLSTEMSRHSRELCVEQRMKIFTGGLLRGLESSELYYPRQELAMFVFGDPAQTLYPSKARHDQTAVTTQLGMFSNCGRSSGFAHLRRRLVNISSTGSMPSGLSRLPSVTKIIPGKPSRLLVNTLAPHCGQKFRSRLWLAADERKVILGYAEERGRFTTQRLLAVKAVTDGNEG